MKKTEKEIKKYEMKISNTVNSLDENVRDRFKALAYLSDQLAELSKKYEEEAKQIEFEADQADKPLYQLRSMIIQGQDIDADDITTDEFDKRLEEIKNEEYDQITVKEYKNVINLVEHKGIPGFWLTAMKFNPVLGMQIVKKDEKLLKDLYDIEYIKQEGSNDFILKFHFHPNDYMQNTVITKRYIMEEEEKIKQIDCTKIKWRAGMNLLEKEKPKKGKGKGKKNKKKAEEEEEEETFFRFFVAKEACKGNPDEDDLEEEDEMRLDLLEEDFDIAVEIRDELLPHALEYYLNIVEEEQVEEGEGEGDEQTGLPDGAEASTGKGADNKEEHNSDGSIDD